MFIDPFVVILGMVYNWVCHSIFVCMFVCIYVYVYIYIYTVYTEYTVYTVYILYILYILYLLYTCIYIYTYIPPIRLKCQYFQDGCWMISIYGSASSIEPFGVC